MTYTVQNTIETKQRQELEYREELLHAVRGSYKDCQSLIPTPLWLACMFANQPKECITDKKIRGNQGELKNKYFGRGGWTHAFEIRTKYTVRYPTRHDSRGLKEYCILVKVMAVIAYGNVRVILPTQLYFRQGYRLCLHRLLKQSAAESSCPTSTNAEA